LGALRTSLDRNCRRLTAPLSPIAACDHFSITLQYSQNLRYGMHDNLSHVDYDYSNRQANYLTVELDISQYRSGSMLVQHVDRSGWFNEPQLRLIREQHLALPDLEGIREAASRLRRTRGEGR